MERRKTRHRIPDESHADAGDNLARITALPSARASPPVDPPDFVGRESERRAIARSARSAASGQPTLVHIEGDIGIGKTALARAATEYVPGFLVVWVACHVSERSSPYAVTDQIGHRLRRAAHEHGMTTAWVDPPVRTVAMTGAGLLSILDQVQRAQPTMIVLDDASWCDEESLACLGFLARRLRTGRVLVLLVSGRHGHPPISNDDPEPPDGNRLQHHLASTAMNTTTLRLKPLTTAETVQMARQATGGEPDPELIDRLTRFARGNPATARRLIDGAEFDRFADDRGLPPSLLAVLRAHLDTLPPDARNVLEALAILGGHAKIAVVARLCGTEDHVTALETLLQRGVVSWLPGDLPMQVSITDPLITEAVYQLLTPRRRRHLHTAAVQLVHGTEQWRHRAAAAIGVNAQLAAELAAEAEVAVEQSRIDHAVRYLRWAADLNTTRAGQDSALLTAAILELWWEMPNDLEQVRAVADAASPSPLRSCVLGLLRRRDTDGPADAVRHFQQCLIATQADAMPGEGELPRWLALLVYAALAEATMALDNALGAVRYGHIVLDNAGDAHLSVLLRAARSVIFGVLGHEGPKAALAVANNIEAELRRTDRITPTQRVFDFERSALSLLIGKPTDAVTLAEVAMSAENPAMDTAHHGAVLVLANAHYQLGDWSKARRAVDTALKMIEEGSLPASAIAPTHLCAASLAAAAGRWVRVDYHVNQIIRVRGVGIEHRLLYLTVAQAALARARGDHEAVIAAFAETAHLLNTAWAARLPWATENTWRPLLAEGLIEAGDLESARQEIHKVGRLAEVAGHLRTTHLWLSGRLAERTGLVQEARRCYEEATGPRTGPDDTPLSRAQAEYAYGLMLHRTGDGTAATLWLRRARQRFARLGATPFTERCGQALLAVGKAPTAPLVELTERERQVASLVGKNLTNHQIADMLFVSEKTVEYHLGHVFAKLGFTSRRQLRGIDRTTYPDNQHD